MKKPAQEFNAASRNSPQLAQRQLRTGGAAAQAGPGGSLAESMTQLTEDINASPRVQSLAQLREQIHESPRVSAQLFGSGRTGVAALSLQTKPGEEKVQAKPKDEKLQAKPKEEKIQAKPQEEKLQTKPKKEKIQGKAKEELRQRRAEDAAASIDTGPQVTSAGSASGLPPQLQSGVESLSGMSMDHVRVHYNSSQPAQLNALAYAQGSDIHMGPGQEQHLPHEAWHVVQQAQGRVQTTKQLKTGVAINDDQALEHEADVMGQQAMQAAGRRSSTGESVRAALTPAALQRRGPVQGVFAGFGGGGWAASNAALPGAMNVFPGGANNMGGGQQGGATARTIDIASTNAYKAPKTLGGFNHFSTLFGNKILYQPGGKPKRYTHLHVINGKTWGPGTADNLTLGSTADNNQHRAQVEDHIRTGLPGANTATPYYGALVVNPSNFIHNNVAYWNNKALPQVPGSQKAAAGAKVKIGGIYKPYVYSAQQAAPTKDRRWAHYRVAPVYGGALSPTIRTNMAKVHKARHDDVLDNLDTNFIVPLAPGVRAARRAHLANATLAMNGAVTAGALAAGVPGTLTAGHTAAKPHVKKAIGAGNMGGYNMTMAGEGANMISFGLWALQAFPSALVCDADLYKASFDGVNPWYKRSEPQTNIPINTN